MTQPSSPSSPAGAPAGAEGEPGPQPRRHGPLAFLAAVLLQAAGSTLEAIGLRHPLRFPVALGTWFLITLFLGLPKVVLTNPSVSDIIRYGDWASAARMAAFLGFAGLFIFQLLRAGSLVSKAGRQLHQIGARALLGRGEALFRAQIGSDEELARWMESVKAWTEQGERELLASLSAEAADAFRRPVVSQVSRHHQRFNEVHDGWLNLLARRLAVLRGLADGRRPGP